MQPDLILTPFGKDAQSGTIDTIPEVRGPSDPPQKATWTYGFPLATMTPLPAGGIPPRGQDFNGVLNAISQHVVYTGAGGQYVWSSAYVAKNGGYPLGALVSRSDRMGLWRNTTTGNTTNPESGGAEWEPEDAGTTTVVMSTANVTLTPLQAARSIIIITGTLTGNRQIILPSYRKNWLIVNRAAGAFSVTCKTSSGSGAEIPTGVTQGIYGDGSSIFLASVIQVATESVAGVVKLATFAEVADSSNNTVAVTPQKLSTWFFTKRASESAQGIAAIATQAIAEAGTDNTTIISPRRLSERLSAIVVDASTTVKGIIRIATGVEAGGGTDTSVAITPSTLSSFFYSRTASEGAPGISAVATQTEANNGTIDDKFITPKKLAARFAALVVAATTTVAGVIRIATSQEAGAGTNTSAAITPKLLSDFFFSKNATEGSAGIAAIATQAEVNAVTDDAKIVTPKKMGLGFATYQEAGGGYVVFPSWLGRIIIQWGSQTIASNTAATYQLAVSFASMFGSVVAGNSYIGTSSQLYAPHANPIGLNQVSLENTNSQPMKIFFLAIGK